jgi:hypothetical protein
MTVGHELSEWKSEEELQLEARCTRCEGSITVLAGDMYSIKYSWPMNRNGCLADHPAQMEAERIKREKLLARVYSIILSEDWGK